MTTRYAPTIADDTLPLVSEVLREYATPALNDDAVYDVRLEEEMNALVARISREYSHACTHAEPCSRILARGAKTDEHISRQKVGKSNLRIIHGQDGHTAMDAETQSRTIARAVRSGVAQAESAALSFYDAVARAQAAKHTVANRTK